MGSLAKDVFNH